MTRLRQEASPRQGGSVTILPVIARVSPHDPAWREQFEREIEAKWANRTAPPPRTRPLIVCHRPEGER